MVELEEIKETLKGRLKHSLCIGPKTIQSRVYIDDEVISLLKLPREDAHEPEHKDLCDND